MVRRVDVKGRGPALGLSAVRCGPYLHGSDHGSRGRVSVHEPRPASSACVCTADGVSCAARGFEAGGRAAAPCRVRLARRGVAGARRLGARRAGTRHGLKSRVRRTRRVCAAPGARRIVPDFDARRRVCDVALREDSGRWPVVSGRWSVGDTQEREEERKRVMTTRTGCTHERARFYSVQRLGNQPPIGLWHCVACKSTVAVQAVPGSRHPVGAA